MQITQLCESDVNESVKSHTPMHAVKHEIKSQAHYCRIFETFDCVRACLRFETPELYLFNLIN